MDNLRDRLICTINEFYDNYSYSAEELADYIIDEIDELSQNNVEGNITFEEISSMIKYVQSKNNIRNLTMLYFVLVYGMKRGHLQNLKWSQLKKGSSGKMMLYNYSLYTSEIPIPDFLVDALNKLREYYKNHGIEDEYVFCSMKVHNRRKDKSNLKLGSQINTIFNDFASILGGEDRCNPAYIRKKLPMFLMLQGCDLKEILVYFNMEFANINTYVSEKDLEILFKNNIKRTSIIDFWENLIRII